MNAIEREIQALLEQAKEGVDTLDIIDDALEELKENDKSISIIKRLFTTQLTKKWIKLASKLSSYDDWESLELSVKDMRAFIKDLYKAVLSPRKVELETRIDNWLRKWSTKSKASLGPFLENAEDEHLTDLSNIVEAIEAIEIENDVIRRQFGLWSTYQVQRLRKLEKEVNILIDWLKQINEVFEEASDMERSLNDMSEFIKDQDDDIVQLIGDNWLEVQLDNLAGADANQDNPGYALWLQALSRQWEDIRQILLTMRPSLVDLSQEERDLLEKYVSENMQNPEISDIERLMSILTLLIKAYGQFNETIELRHDGAAPLESSLEPDKRLKDLWDRCPILPLPAEVGNLLDYTEKIQRALDVLNLWLEDFTDMRDEITRTYDRWKELSLKHQLESQIKALEEDVELETLGDLIRMHNNLLKITHEILEELKKGLPTDEKTVLEVILHRLSEGKDCLDVIDLIADLPSNTGVDSLVHLAEKNLVYLEVKT